jgi:hypothetical protein
MCVVSTRGTNYQEDVTHTWRLTGNPPEKKGDVREWPAFWTAQGSGAGPTGRWTINVPETNAPIAIYEVPGVRGQNRLRITSTHGLLVARALTQRDNVGRDLTGSIQEWQFPRIDEVPVATATISDTRTRTLPFWPAWQRPVDAVATETCKWRFARGDDTQISANPSGSQPAASIPITQGTTTVITPGTAIRAAAPSPGIATIASTWIGSARCRLGADGGSAYSEQITHEWTIADGAAKQRDGTSIYPATWSATGSGKNEGTSPAEMWVGPQHYWTQWTINVPPIGSQLTFEVVNGQLTITTPRDRLTSANDGATGSKTYRREHDARCTLQLIPSDPWCASKGAEGLSFAVEEWEFPTIQAPAGSARISGSAAPKIARPISPMQPGSVVPTARCTWDFVRVGP